MKTLIGTIVVFHMNMEQQIRAGGSHTPANNLGLQHAPAIVTRVGNIDGDKKDYKVNLKVLCDSRDDIWVKDVSYGSGVGQWEFLEETELKDNVIERFQEAPLEPTLTITRNQ